MPRIRSTRYDKIAIYTEPQLFRMYIGEGMSPDLARSKAKQLHKELNTYAEREVYFWKKVHSNELPDGLDVEQYLEGEDRYAS
jgi:hypothetical protein